ncbi:MAG: Hint domain-containing protein [Pseudomonadota bacterium]
MVYVSDPAEAGTTGWETAEDWTGIARAPGSWGVSQGTQVQTDRGLAPAGLLLAGDMVQCDDGTMRTVLAALMVAPDTSAMGPATVVIERGALGRNTPSEDIVLGRRQQIALTHPVLRDLTGSDTALVEAGQLIGLPGIRLSNRAQDPMITLVIDGPGLIETGGVSLSGFPATRSAIETLDIAARTVLFKAVPRTRYSVEASAFAPDLPVMMAREAWLAVESTADRGRLSLEENILEFATPPESDMRRAIARGSALSD